MKKLDILQNPPLNPNLNECLLKQKTQNLSPILQEGFKKNQQAIHEINAYFNAECGGNFNFLSAPN